MKPPVVVVGGNVAFAPARRSTGVAAQGLITRQGVSGPTGMLERHARLLRSLVRVRRGRRLSAQPSGGNYARTVAVAF
ncbi:hypothetical protein CHELA20_53368 [Hyphomicrobiales bacterium]|nr:hypothetical protein CHELA41_21559 [Hyphomicrobiales bacterium]CAH1684110.1 hypothetical protein CHELA20_53368 [Hyphomicrobiales bacterium]